jgi:hypothetical protein
MLARLHDRKESSTTEPAIELLPACRLVNENPGSFFESSRMPPRQI